MAAKVKDPGVGKSSSKKAKRFINPDGSFNIKHINRRDTFTNSYDYLINISWSKFFLWVLLGYVTINSLFAVVYTVFGISEIAEPSGSIFKDFLNAFFFSAQTITTVGYGAMSPKGMFFGIISSLEALVGLLSFSFVTGLLYGRFSKPRSNIKFSNNLILRKHNGRDSIMFRLMSKNGKVMIKPRIEATLVLSLPNGDNHYSNTFFSLKLERSAITYLPTTWTVVHPIDDKSPLRDYDSSEINDLHGEILILVSYYDESFAQEVHQTHSFVLKNLKFNNKFIPAFYYDEEGYTILDHNKLDQTEELK